MKKNKFALLIASFLGLSILLGLGSCKKENSLPTLEELQKHSEIISGKGVPSKALGKVGDFYIDSETMTLYGAKTAEGWGNGYPLYGKDGKNGINGKDGKDGLNGKDGKNGVNGKDGKDGLNGKDGKNGVNGKEGKDGLNGKDGKNGVNGKDGKDGLNGKDGSRIHGGEGLPSPKLGQEGDWYIDKKNKRLYGPKTANGWADEFVDLSIPATSAIDFADCKAEDVKVIRAIAAANNFADDFAADDLSQWKSENIKLIWNTNDEGKATLTSLIVKEGSKLTSLTLNETNKLEALRAIVIKNKTLSELDVTHQPSLRVLKLDGMNEAPLTKLTFKELPALETVAFVNLPKLKGANGYDNGFKLNLYFNYDKLTDVTIKNTGIVEFYSETSTPISKLDLANNKKLQVLNLDETILPTMNFTKEEYPELKTIKFRKVKAVSSNDYILSIKDLPLLGMIMINKCEGIFSVSLDNLPKVTETTIADFNLSELTIKSMSALKSLDLSNAGISELDLLQGAPALKTLTLTGGWLSSTDDLKLPKTLTTLVLDNCEYLEKIDVSTYPNIEALLASMPTLTEEPYLTKVNITGASKLYRLLLRNNAITTIETGNTMYPILEEFEVNDNALTLEGLAKLYKALYNNIEEEGYMSASDVKMAKQRYLITPEGKTVSLKAALDIFKASGVDNPFSLEVYTKAEPDTPQVEGLAYTYDKTTGLVTFLKSGKYSLYFSFTDPIYSKAFMTDSYESKFFDVVVN